MKSTESPSVKSSEIGRLELPLSPSTLPEILHVEVTTKCNLSCVFCKQSEPAVRARGELPLEVFQDLLRQLRSSCRRINLWGTGEPLLYPDTLVMARLAADVGIPRIKLSTNGTLLSTEMAERVIASGVTSVRIALESTTPEEYRALRGGDSHRVIVGIERLVAARDRTGSKMKIVVATVVTDQSPETLERVRLLAERLGADQHELMPNIWADQFPISRRRPPLERCDQMFRSLHVLANGDVIPCCHSLMGEVVLGNVFQTPVSQIWTGALARQTREEFLANRFSLCEACNFGTQLDREGNPIP